MMIATDQGKMDEDTYYTKLYAEIREDIESLKQEGSDNQNSEHSTCKPTPSRDPEGVLQEEKFFMCVAFLAAKRSDDPSTKVGACIVNERDPEKIVAIGHNDLPYGCVKEQRLVDFKFDWNQREVSEGKWPASKYPYVVHASINAILNKNAENLEGCTLYTTLFPGHEDVKLIIQSGIKKVIYYDKKKQKFTEIAEKNLKDAEVETMSYLKLEKEKDESSDQLTATNQEDKTRTDLDIKVFPNKKGPEVINKGGNTNGLQDKDFYMAMALLTAKRSKDPHRQVGACIINQDGKIVGVGYNDMPCGVSRSWGNFKDQDQIDYVKYHNVVHAEANAIMRKTCIDLKGCTIYVTLFPCNECTKLIIQSGIERIYFLEGEPKIPIIGPQGTSTGEKRGKFYMLTSRRLLEMAGYSFFPDTSTVHSRSKFCQKYVPSEEIEINFPVQSPRREQKVNAASGVKRHLFEDGEKYTPENSENLLKKPRHEDESVP